MGLLHALCSSSLMHSPVQMKLAAEAAHGARGEQGKINLPCSISEVTEGMKEWQGTN